MFNKCYTCVYLLLQLRGSTPPGGSEWAPGGSEWDGATAFSWISKPRVEGWGIPHILAHHDLKPFQWQFMKQGPSRRPKRERETFLFSNTFSQRDKTDEIF